MWVYGGYSLESGRGKVFPEVGASCLSCSLSGWAILAGSSRLNVAESVQRARVGVM